MAFDPDDGWTHFVRPVTEGERLWEGDPQVPEGEDAEGLGTWVEKRRGRPIAVLGSPVEGLDGVAGDEQTAAVVRQQLDAVRRVKDAAEIALVERAVAATAAGHARAREVIRPGVSEREIRIELEAEMFRRGADAVGYGSIVGAGNHAAVLHFEPGPRVVSEEDLVLVDAGGSIAGYTADVTRTYSAGDRLSGRRQELYDVVLEALLESTERCRAGTEWHDVHRAAARVLASGLRDLGLLVGEVDGLLESEAIALFFPHGVGHMVGLGVRDVGGRLPEREEGRMCCGARVRVDLPLEEGFLMTVEPGLYLVPAILDDPGQRDRFGHAVRWDALDDWRPLGGVRIEDNVLVTAGAPRVLTEGIPK
jgi:Xaa-Pro aminopeptidase